MQMFRIEFISGDLKNTSSSYRKLSAMFITRLKFLLSPLEDAPTKIDVGIGGVEYWREISFTSAIENTLIVLFI